MAGRNKCLAVLLILFQLLFTINIPPAQAEDWSISWNDGITVNQNDALVSREMKQSMALIPDSEVKACFNGDKFNCTWLLWEGPGTPHTEVWLMDFSGGYSRDDQMRYEIYVMHPDVYSHEKLGAILEVILPESSATLLDNIKKLEKSSVQPRYLQGDPIFMAISEYQIHLKIKDTANADTTILGQYKAEYYNNNNFEGTPVITRNETKIENDWSLGSPDTKINNDNFSVKWTGDFYLPSANYIFTAQADDAITVTIDGVEIIKQEQYYLLWNRLSILNLQSGVHKIEIKYREDSGSALCNFTFKEATSSSDWDGDGYNDAVDRYPMVAFLNPVILLHGRDDNSVKCFGALSAAAEWNSTDTKPEEYYSNLTNQEITGPRTFSFTSNIEADLAPALETKGYKNNVNLFVLNYPNWDKVSNNSSILKTYVENLRTDRSSKCMDIVANNNGHSPQDLTGKYVDAFAFFPCRDSVSGIRANLDCRFDIVAHSMGGLVARYSIENENGQEWVRKLISIDTPHWGSVIAYWSDPNVSPRVQQKYLLCDNDLQEDAVLFGGTKLEGGTADALKVEHGKVKYYAIAGWKPEKQPNLPEMGQNDIFIDLNNRTTDTIATEIRNAIAKELSLDDRLPILYFYNYWYAAISGDGAVSNASQIGWNRKINQTPEKSIEMEKMSINLNILENVDIFHIENQHRKAVIEQVIKYLRD